MTRTTTKNLSCILVIILLFTTIFSVPVNVSATTFPQTHPNTHVNTGDNIIDITSVAKTQIGYKENQIGTKYGFWYNGIFTNQPWCAMFVSWCANQAGIPTNIIPKFASCSWGVNWFKDADLWQDSKYYGGDYIPKKGDIVFYRNSGSASVSDHVGIVIGVNGEYLNVIEGNATNESCCEYKTNSSRTLSNKYVIGYGTPRYIITDPDNNGGETVEEPTTFENWIVGTADYLSLRESYSTSSARLESIPMGTSLEVTEFYKGKDYLWGKTTYNEKEGWCALDYCTYINGNINGVYYQLPPVAPTETQTISIGENKKLYFENSLGATYTSSKVNVATVSEDGTVTGVSSGNTIITCTTQTGTAQCKIVINKPYLNETKVTTCVGDGYKLQVIGVVGEIKFKSKNKEIAKVGKKGKITGVAPGTTTVTAKIGDIKLTCDVTVTQFPTTYQNFTVKTSKANLYTGVDGTLLAVVDIDTPLKVYEVKYTDTYTWGKTIYNNSDMWVKINELTYVNGDINGTVYKVAPYLKKNRKEVYVDDTYKINIKHQGKAKTTYSVEDEKIATVDKEGVITAISEGSTTITVECKEKTMTFTIIVKNPFLETTNFTVIKGQQQQIKVVGGSGEIKYKSSDKKIAKVNKEGIIKGKGYGIATITVVRNGISMECVVASYSPVLEKDTFIIKAGKERQIVVLQNYSSDITYKSMDKKIAKVGKKGVIKPVSKGKTKIAVTVDGITLYCTVKIKAVKNAQ